VAPRLRPGDAGPGLGRATRSSLQRSSRAASHAFSHGAAALGCDRAHDESEQHNASTTTEIAIVQGIGDGKVGGGGCIAYALFKLGVFRSIGHAMVALDIAGEAIFRRRAHEHKPSPHVGLCYPKIKVYTAGLTWCPEAVQHAVQAANYRLHKVHPAPNTPTMPALQTLVESTATSAQMLLLEGTLAQVSLRSVRGCVEEIVIDVEDPSPQESPELWRHTLAIRDGKLYDLYCPRGLAVENLWLTDNEIGAGGYMCEIAKVWSVKPQQSRGKRKQLADWSPGQRNG
jgi:hypothetical protein